jgi:hypothetical protein
VIKIYIVVFWVMTPCSLVRDTNVSKDYIASIFKVGMKNLKTEVEYSSEMLVPTYQTTRYHTLEDHNMKFQCQYNTNFYQNIFENKTLRWREVPPIMRALYTKRRHQNWHDLTASAYSNQLYTPPC